MAECPLDISLVATAVDELLTAVDELLTELHIDKRLYNTHSFRIGAATSAIQANIPDVHIQMLGGGEGKPTNDM